jgi:hypothetical protein
MSSPPASKDEHPNGPRAEDPFFSLRGPPHWNAFVGRQGEERYYVDGYLEAAIELATSVLEKDLSGQRDTLVMPILFTARHGLELSLKHAIRELSDGRFLNGPAPENHDIAAHWEILAKVPRCDAHLPRLVAAMEPFVRSLAAVDEDGQALRYFVRRDGAQSLEDFSLVNLKVVLISLRALQEILKDLRYRVCDLVEERGSGTHTSVCSRSDLFMIAHRLPPRAEWGTPAFMRAKAAIREEFGLSSRQFSDALNIIQRHRQLGAMLGLEFDLAHLDDESAIFAIALWRSLHQRPKEPQPKGGFIIRARAIDIEEIDRAQAALHAAARQLVERLSVEVISDLETVYQMGRGADWPENYETRLEQTKAKHATRDSLFDEAVYLLGKGNLGDAVSNCVDRLGRPRLGRLLMAI